MQAWADVFLDPQPFQVGNVAEVTRDSGRHWQRHLRAARQRGKLGGVLLLLDGDLDRVRGEPFCVWRFGGRLADWARAVGAGSLFSVACVFARRSEEHTSELQSLRHLVCRLLLEKKKNNRI